MKRLLPILFLFLFFEKNFSQNIIFSKDTFDYFEMSLEQLMSMKAHGVPSELEELINSLILAASKRPLTARESPGIVTLITQEEIRNSGARDLIDILRLVPGIDFGVDVEGVVGIGTRGLWAHEGKMLVLVDGQEMNELLFATNQFGNHFAIEQIKKIEVIRGPGSAIYGGFAEYGVINIITKTASDFSGVVLAGTYGQMESAMGRRNFNLSAGKQKKDFQFSLGAFFGNANRSDQNFSDFDSSSYNMAGNSNLNSTNINVGMSFKGFSARWIMDLYQTTTRDSYDKNEPVAYPLNFKSHFTEIKYAAILGKKKNLTLTPKINIKSQTPWQTLSDFDTIIQDYSKATQRYSGNITASYNLTRKINFVAGAEVYKDRAVDQVDSSFFSNGKKEVSYFNQACFLQALAKTRFVNFILGARYDIHSEYGSAFVPRVGFTKKFKKFHFKALYSNAFRAPSIENINLKDSTGMKPELTQVMELEAGYQITRKSLLTANFFDIITKDPIVYYYDDSLKTDNYRNFGGAGSRGVEVEYRMRDKWGYFIFNYSNYTVAGKEKIADYKIPGNESMLLAFPTHKANLNASIKAGKYFSISPTLSYIGERYGYTGVDTAGYSVAEKFPSLLLANLFVNTANYVKGLTIGIGCYDILDSKYTFIQPYNGYHAPLPGPSREIIVKIIYEVKAKKMKKEK
ncbi:MAG: TonB-dependent receptor plug domain-containing protein [Bacteroidetes bacterium]|nr:TonB-dependent receptor plug domain-containing protein [Bacteroidota bacterium]